MKLIPKIIHVLSIICYVLISIYAIICVPLLFGYHPVVVLSGSMEPTYKVGSVIYYKSVPADELKPGDVITFTLKGEYVSHRVVSIDGDSIETKGDANNSSDPEKIPFENIVGRVAKIGIPFVGYFVKTTNDYLVYVVLAAAIILVLEFILSNMDIFNKNKKSENYEKEEK